MSRAGLANRHLRNRPARGAHLREWSLREPCSSAEGGAGACSILANRAARFCRPRPAARRLHSSKAIVATLPGADERIGDIPRPREGRPRRRRGARSRGGPPAARRVTDAAPATALRPEGPCSARVRRCRDWSDTGSETARGVGAAPLLVGFARVARTERTELRGECSRSLCAKQDGGQRLADAHGRTKAGAFGGGVDRERKSRDAAPSRRSLLPFREKRSQRPAERPGCCGPDARCRFAFRPGRAVGAK